MFKMAIKKIINFIRLFHYTKVLTKPSLKGSSSLSNKLPSLSNILPSLSNILHVKFSFNLSYNINQIIICLVQILIIDNGKLSTIYR